MKIYTRTGDAGQTSLIGGTRVPKHHLRIETYGTVDELNSYIGYIADQLNDLEEEKNVLIKIQDRLFTIGASLASDPEKSKMKIPDLLNADITLLENEMDRMNTSLPELKSFILPGGNITASSCHLARCVCRRTERLATELSENSFVHELVLPYLNRLSDYLFVLARFVCFKRNGQEVLWNPRS
jgi:cob(I)alamin adenosyltransferase